jgi:hypothetical protein
MQKSAYVKSAYVMALLAAFALTGNACSKKGPAEKAGEKLDNVGDKIHDAVTPDGPAEKAGKKIDKAVDDVRH